MFSNPLWATTGYRPVFEAGVARSHTRTLDEDVFAPFLPMLRKCPFVVLITQGLFTRKETTVRPEN